MPSLDNWNTYLSTYRANNPLLTFREAQQKAKIALKLSKVVPQITKVPKIKVARVAKVARVQTTLAMQRALLAQVKRKLKLCTKDAFAQKTKKRK
jgi:hypothetical protein